MQRSCSSRLTNLTAAQKYTEPPIPHIVSPTVAGRNANVYVAADRQMWCVAVNAVEHIPTNHKSLFIALSSSRTATVNGCNGVSN